MRIADGQNQAGFLRNLQRVKADMDGALERMYTGKRVNFASDDSHAAAELMRLSEEVDRLKSRFDGISQIDLWLGASEDAIAGTQQVLLEAHTEVLKAANFISEGQGYEAIAEAVAGLKSRLQGLAGARVSGSYVFSGTMTDTPPYDSAGTYQGNNSAIKLPLDEGTVQINFTADVLFGEIGVGGPLDLLDRFETALRTGDDATVQSLVGEIKSAQIDNTTLLARVGSRRARVLEAGVRIENKQTQLATRAADLGAADMAKAISDVQRLETNYQATLAAGARLFGPNFFDYLG